MPTSKVSTPSPHNKDRSALKDYGCGPYSLGMLGRALLKSANVLYSLGNNTLCISQIFHLYFSCTLIVVARLCDENNYWYRWYMLRIHTKYCVCACVCVCVCVCVHTCSRVLCVCVLHFQGYIPDQSSWALL